MIGDEDAFSERKYYSTTIRCASTKGRVYYINNKDLHNIIQNKSISYELFGKEALSKDVEILKKLNIKDEFLNKSKKISERLKVKEIMINFYSEFFKQTSKTHSTVLMKNDDNINSNKNVNKYSMDLVIRLPSKFISSMSNIPNVENEIEPQSPVKPKISVNKASMIKNMKLKSIELMGKKLVSKFKMPKFVRSHNSTPDK